jgi:hypothetical protein
MKSTARADAMAKADTRINKMFDDAGLRGDKLDLYKRHNYHYFRLAGGKKPADLKQFARAKVIFHWFEDRTSDWPYVIHTITRYKFKGDKLVGESTQRYTRRRDQELPRKAFR